MDAHLSKRSVSVPLLGFIWLFLPGSFAGDIKPEEALRYNKNTYHPVVDYLKSDQVPVTDEQLAEIEKLPLEIMWGVLQGMGYTNTFYAGLKATLPEARLVGRAVTIRYLPVRPDMEKAMQAISEKGGWPAKYHTRAAEDAKPGDVLVVNLGGQIAEGIFFGDISALGARMSGARGAVLYGSTRDLDGLREMKDFPVYALGFHPSGATQMGVDWNVPIRIGDATVMPGDVVVGTEEAVLFFPPEVADEVIRKSRQKAREEEFKRELVRSNKHRFRDIYPLNEALKKQYEDTLEREKRD